MQQERGKFNTAIIIVGGLLILALAAAAIYIPIYISDERENAYEKGSYDHAYSALEAEWDDSRQALVHASLAGSVCLNHADADPFCRLLTGSRERLLDHELPPHISDASDDEYRLATYEADSEVRQLDAHIRTIDRYIATIENNSDSDIWDTIGLTAGLVPEAQNALTQAERAISEGNATSDVLEAKAALEAVLARYEVEEFPTYWDAENIVLANDQLATAITDLTTAL